MPFQPKSIAEQIKCLARLTGASESFIGQVRALFEKKGICLDADAGPYVGALEEAFRREENIRASTRRARESMSKLQTNFSKMGRAYVERAKSWTEKRTRAAKPPSPRRPSRQPIAIRGDHRSYITKQQREELPMVPGPEDLQ